MTSFGWKKKAPNCSNTSLAISKGKSLYKAFPKDLDRTNQDDSDADISDRPSDYDWCVSLKKRRLDESLETNAQKIERLKNEGIALAESEEFWQAIGRWDAALQLIEKDSSFTQEGAKCFFEMKSQALIQLHEWEPAIEAAHQAIKVDAKWYSAYQTLGRAHLGVGNVLDAIKAFSRGRHLNPEDEEIKIKDLEWAASLLTHQKLMAAAREINQA